MLKKFNQLLEASLIDIDAFHKLEEAKLLREVAAIKKRYFALKRLEA